MSEISDATRRVPTKTTGKMMLRTFVTSLLIGLCALAYGQKKEVRTVDVLPHGFTMTMTCMLPRKFPMKALMRDYYVKLHGDSLECYLPYMGEVYQPTMTDEGLNFNLHLSSMRVKEKKKSKHLYYLVRKGFISYEYHFILYPEGKGTLILNPSNAQACTYEGEWENH